MSALAFLHNNGLATGTNFHDADGVTRDANPERFAAFAAAVGAEPTADAVAFAIGNRTYADMLQRVVLDPLIGEGLDMAWASTAMKVARPHARMPARRLPPPTYVTLARASNPAQTDFQQGFPGVDSVRGLVPTAVLNHHRFYNFSSAPGTRGTYHSRYAGRGDHRHTSHFGGDVDQTWESLQFMIYCKVHNAISPLAVAHPLLCTYPCHFPHHRGPTRTAPWTHPHRTARPLHSHGHGSERTGVLVGPRDDATGGRH